jgi:hypothetical protein
VRWPDVAQAISAARPEWQQDPGLFDLPYDPNSVLVSSDEAATIASAWGARPPSDTEDRDFGPQLIRRMPANWSNLSPAEVRAWSLDLVVTRTKRRANQAGAERRGRLASLRARLRLGRRRQRLPELAGSLLAESTPAELVPAGLTLLGSVSGNGKNGVAAHDGEAFGSGAVDERRRHARVRVNGRARIRCGRKTISAELVDVSKSGVHCVVSDGRSILKSGGRLGAPLILKGDDPKFQVRLTVTGTVTWHLDSALGTHLGVAFDELDVLDDEALEQLQSLLAN